MKRVHVVYSHPEPQSFVAAMRDTVMGAFSRAGWQVSLSDLHVSNFNPVASANDFAARKDPEYLTYSLEQRNAWNHRTLAPDIEAEVHAVQEADLLVLIFPVFWYSVPAQLKGWIDRVFLSGIFYGGRRIYDQGGMTGKRALVVTSLGGREHMFGPEAIHGDLSGMLRHLLQGTLGYVGYNVYRPYFAYHVPYVQSGERDGMLKDLERQIGLLDTREFLAMPKLAEFDQQFKPLAATLLPEELQTR